MRRGEIYFVNLHPATGREQAGRRPVLVVSDDAINSKPLVVTVVVGTSGGRLNENYPTNVRVTAAESGLPKETIFLCYQIRSLDQSRFAGTSGKPSQPAGRLMPETMRRVEDAICRALRLES
jgi:mRNA interferase MazF